MTTSAFAGAPCLVGPSAAQPGNSGASQGLEQGSKVIEMDVGIRGTAKNLEQELLAYNPYRRV
ncbi:MAG: hypothetical protein ACLQVN_24885 [Bryobacteraceae bacterium]